jgi:hypothetical protein
MTAERLFQMEKSASNLADYIIFFKSYRDMEKAGRVTAADAVRMAALVIRWLDSEADASPPRRGGGGAGSGNNPPPDEQQQPHESAYMAGYTFLAMSLNMPVDTHEILSGGVGIYPSLPRPAQAAWDRLLTRHWRALPLPARIYLGHVAMRVRKGEGEAAALRSLAAALTPRLLSGDLMFDVGGGRREWLGCKVLEVRAGLERICF